MCSNFPTILSSMSHQMMWNHQVALNIKLFLYYVNHGTFYYNGVGSITCATSQT